nr:MAG TPA: hypothetical protein [Bacteriophage sp.]
MSEVVDFVVTTPLWVKRDAGVATPARQIKHNN